MADWAPDRGIANGLACGPCRLQGRLIACDSCPVDRAREHCSSGDALPQNGLTPSGVRRLGFLGCRSPVRNASTGLQRESVNFQGSCVGQDELSSPGGISDVWSRAKNVDMVGFGKKEGRKGERGQETGCWICFAPEPSKEFSDTWPKRGAARPHGEMYPNTSCQGMLLPRDRRRLGPGFE